MSPAKPPTLSFQLPEQQSVDVYLVRLADGRLVARTKDELAEIPGQLQLPATGTPQEK